MRTFLKSWSTIAMVFLVSLTAFSQLEESKLRALNIEKAADLRMKIGLDKSKEKQLADILYNFDAKLARNVSDPKTFYEKSQILSVEREKAIAELLNSQQHQLYRMLEINESRSLKESYFDIVSYLSSDTSLLSEFFEFEFEVVMPVVSEFHQKLRNQMSREDRVALLSFHDYLYDLVDSLKITALSDTSIMAKVIIDEPQRVAFNKLLTEYDQAYVEILKELSRYQSSWYQQRQGILEKYLLYNHVQTMLQKEKLLAKTGMSSKLHKMEFFLVEPYDRIKYVKNRRLFLKVGQALVFGR